MSKDAKPGNKPAVSAKAEKVRKRSQAEEEARRQALEKRMDLVNIGIKAFQRKEHAEAVKAFLTYLRVLEDWKGVSEGGLNPKLFDRKKDLPELLLITGVYWDLTKLYDRTKTPEKKRLFHHYMEKFILFSRGMPYQSVSGESLRRYIEGEKPLNRDDFMSARKMLAPSRCFVATALADELRPGTMTRLRSFRDQVLKSRALGRAFIKWYYASGPSIASRVETLPRPVRVTLARILDSLAVMLG